MRNLIPGAVISLLCWLFSNTASATGQIAEILIVQGDTLEMLEQPFCWNKELDDHLIRITEKRGPVSTALWRGYIGEWKIENNLLVLNKVYLGDGYGDDGEAPELVDLDDPVFDKYRIDGRITASWFYGKALCGKGEVVYYEHMGFNRNYEFETEFFFESGRLKNRIDYHNTVTPGAVSRQEAWQTVQDAFDWGKFPELADQSLSVGLTIRPDRSGRVEKGNITVKIYNTEISERRSKAYRKEITRCLLLVPSWEIREIRSEIQPLRWSVRLKKEISSPPASAM